jgi:hypothetical protein
MQSATPKAGTMNAAALIRPPGGGKSGSFERSVSHHLTLPHIFKKSMYTIKMV